MLALLQLLVDRAGDVVTKEELLAGVWPDTVVGDAAIATCVQELRHALDDDARRPRYIETLHRRGYRFLAIPVATSFSVRRTIPPAAQPTLAVGRAAELERLRGWLARASTGERQIVFVTGEAGIGKTAIVSAFVTELGDADDVRVCRGQCIETYGAGEAYLPLLDALGRLCRGPDAHDVADALVRHAPTWLAQMPSRAGAIETAAASGRRASPARMLRELTELLEAVTTEKTIVLWLEDLQCSDPSTLDWLQFFARRSEPARVLVIATLRPSGMPPLRAVMSELRLHGLCHELRLTSLGEDAVEEYLRRRFRVEAADTDGFGRVARAVRARSDGNPLFMVNIVQDLVARGLFVPRGDRWRLEGAIDTAMIGVPADIRALIDRQFESLTSQEQRVLGTAAVAGAEFSTALVAPVAGLGIHEVDAVCASLAHRQLFLHVGTTAEPSADGTISTRYAFLHALYPEALCDRLSPARRIELHGRVGRGLEAEHGARAGDVAAELAMHFERARDSQRAVRYLELAARNAVRRNAPKEAVVHLARAIELVPTTGHGGRPDEQAGLARAFDLRLTLRPLLSLLGEGRRALAVLREAEALAERLGDDRRRARVSAFLSIAHAGLGEMDHALTSGSRAAAIAGAVGDLDLRLLATAALEQTHFFRNEHAPVVALATRNLQELPDSWQYESFGNVSPASIYDRWFLIQSLAELGRFDEGRRVAADMLRFAAASDDPFVHGSAFYATGVLHLDEGNWDDARSRLEQAVAAHRRGDVVLHLPWAMAASSWVLARAGETQTASSHVGEAERLLDGHAERGVALARAWAYHALGRACLALERSDEARRFAELALVTSTGQPGYRAQALHLLGDLAAASHASDTGQAEELHREALALATGDRLRPLMAHVHLGLGRLYCRADKRALAQEHLTAALMLYGEMEMRSWIDETESALRVSRRPSRPRGGRR